MSTTENHPTPTPKPGPIALWFRNASIGLASALVDFGTDHPELLPKWSKLALAVFALWHDKIEWTQQQRARAIREQAKQTD